MSCFERVYKQKLPGGLVLGADIDYLTLHARSRPSRVGQKVSSFQNFGRLLMLLLQVRAVDENMAANFHQYGLASRSFQPQKYFKNNFSSQVNFRYLGVVAGDSR